MMVYYFDERLKSYTSGLSETCHYRCQHHLHHHHHTRQCLLCARLWNNQEQLNAEISIPVIILLESAFIVCFAIGISGAISYNKNFVVVSLTAYCVRFGMAAVQHDLLAMIAQMLFVYPHAFLIKEIKDGIMTPHNYENEKQSCCCV